MDADAHVRNNSSSESEPVLPVPAEAGSAVPAESERGGTAAAEADPGTGADSEADAESDQTSLRSLFRERALKISTMDRGLRTATIVAIVCIVGSAVLVLARNVTPATVSLAIGGNKQEIGLPYFIGTLVLFSVGLGYLTAAAALARPAVGIPLIAILLLAIAFYTGAISTSRSGGLTDLLPRWAAISSRGLLIALALLACVTFWVNKQDHARHALRRSHVIVLSGYIIIFGAYWTTLALTSPTVGKYYTFGPAIAVLLSSISLIMYPMLQVAAADFGEWGQLSAYRVSVPLRGRPSGEIVISLLLCVALASYGFVNLGGSSPFSGARLASAGRGVLFVAGVCLLVYLTVRALRLRGRSWPETLGFASLFAVSALVTWIIVPLAGYLNGNFAHVSPAVVTANGHFAPGADVVSAGGGKGKTRFTLLLPNTWVVESAGDGLTAKLIQNPRKYEFILVDAAQGMTTMSEIESTPPIKAGPPVKVDGWQRVATRDPGRGATGFLWLRSGRVAGTVVSYVVTDEEAGYASSQSTPLFDAVINSFRGANEAPARPPAPVSDAAFLDAHFDRELAYQAGISLLLVILAFSLIVSGRVKLPIRAVGAILLFGMVTVMFILTSFSSLGRFLFGKGSGWPGVGEFSIYFGIGVAGMAGLLIAWARRQDARRWARQLIGLIGALVALDVMYRLYTHALSAADISAWAALILLLAVIWEVVMSGKAITNQGSHRIPRSSRVLGFSGYAIMVCGAVLFFSAQTASNGVRSDQFFEPEAVTKAALFAFALPLFVLMFFLPRRSETVAEPGSHPDGDTPAADEERQSDD
jgi:hypothetical protein